MRLVSRAICSYSKEKQYDLDVKFFISVFSVGLIEIFGIYGASKILLRLWRRKRKNAKRAKDKNSDLS